MATRDILSKKRYFSLRWDAPITGIHCTANWNVLIRPHNVNDKCYLLKRHEYGYTWVFSSKTRNCQYFKIGEPISRAFSIGHCYIWRTLGTSIGLYNRDKFSKSPEYWNLNQLLPNQVKKRGMNRGRQSAEGPEQFGSERRWCAGKKYKVQ